MRLTDNPKRDVPICAAVTVLLGLILWPVPVCGCGSPATACLASLKQQAMGMLEYAGDHDDRYPRRDFWTDEIAPYMKDAAVFHDPDVPTGAYGYAFNAALSVSKAPPRAESVPMVYDSSNPIRNASDPATSLPSPGRHKGRNNIAYADGHAKRVAAP